MPAGVTYDNDTRKWRVRPYVRAKSVLLGYFDTEEEANIVLHDYKTMHNNEFIDFNKLARSPEAWDAYSRQQLSTLSKSKLAAGKVDRYLI